MCAKDNTDKQFCFVCLFVCFFFFFYTELKLKLRSDEPSTDPPLDLFPALDLESSFGDEWPAN